MTPKKVAVALSGGIDSLISGFLVKQQFKEVIGLHFTTGYETASVDTQFLQTQLGFPVYTLDLTQAFEQEVVQYFIQAYMAGTTPNPCLKCNYKIKFGLLLDHALALGADALATGHYATVVNALTCPGTVQSHLEKGADAAKDQSYFLSMLEARQLDRVIFPLASATKDEVRRIAKTYHLAPAVPSESQDICFIHDQNFSDFILKKQQQPPCPGRIVNADGKVVGHHNGLHTFTIGQRRGINVPAERPYYVRRIDMAANTLHVCFKEDLARSEMAVDEITWNYPETERISSITTKIRYSHKGAMSSLQLNGNRGKVVFDTPQNAVTPGQAAVFYMGSRVLGAGIIQ